MPRSIKDRLYISTIDKNAEMLAKKYGVGLEIADFCVASNMDEDFLPYGAEGIRKMQLGLPMTFHFPFAELSPCAIDPKIRQVVLSRHEQALELALENGAKKLVIHGGYIPLVYYPRWYIEQSVSYWKEFLDRHRADFVIYLENVMEEDYCYMLDIAKGVDDERFRLCLDIGHCNCISKQSPREWVRGLAPYIGHLHIHNNDGVFDHHRPVYEGTAPMEELIALIEQLASGCGYTIECMESESSLHWLTDRGFLNEAD